MKHIFRVITLGLLLFWQPRFLTAQEAKPACKDILYMTDGGKLRGQVQALKANGDTLVFQTWSGIVFNLPKNQVKRIVQKCKDQQPLGLNQIRPYSFKEKGWYHHTRMAALIGQAYYGSNRTGFVLQHSSGWMFKRQLGAGLGIGFEMFDPKGNDAATYPVFAEMRSYFFQKNTTPYATLGAGWAFTGNTANERWGQTDRWKGGWLVQAEVGYRIGNYFNIFGGIRLQHKQREWTSVWGPDSGFGVDRILHKRFVLGIGLLL